MITSGILSRIVPPVALLALLATTASGCSFFRGLAGTNSVDLTKADVKTMAVDIRKDRKTICPREPVQMAIFAEVVLEGENAPKKLETWAGHEGANKNDKLDFPDFAFHSDQGAFDKDGWFSPATSLLATVDKEFEIKSVYKRRPDQFSFTTKYKPDYQCIKGAGKDGAFGPSGSAGDSGKQGTSGQSGSSSSAGGDGTAGGLGGHGGDGGSGSAGAKLVVFVTMAKTPFYDKLVAVKIGGDMDDFLLAPTDHPIVLRASGGGGGSGGAGGHGGGGGSGGSGNPAGQGGAGGQGGSGGKGGSGGAGGQIDLVYDARFPELAGAVKLDVSGGGGGAPGSPGGAGSGGSGGSGQTPSGATTSVPTGTRGGDGSQGSSGAAGQRGADGRASTKAGDVKARFDGVNGITLL